MRQLDDPAYGSLVERIHLGKGTGNASWCIGSHQESDYRVLCSRLISYIRANNPDELKSFESAPVIVSERRIRDEINLRKAFSEAVRMGVSCHLYAVRHSRKRVVLIDEIQKRLCKYRFPGSVESQTNKDLIGELPLFCGMRVMITENVAINCKVVDGSEGEIHTILYSMNSAR